MPNSVCIVPEDLPELASSYYHSEEYSFLTLNLKPCSNRTDCKTPQEIEDYVLENTFQVFKINTKFAYETFQHDEHLEEWPNLGNRSNYMPVVVNTELIHFGPISGYNRSSKLAPWSEFRIRKDKVIIDDNRWNLDAFSTKRTAEYINIHNTYHAKIYKKDTIKRFTFVLDNKSEVYERTV